MYLDTYFTVLRGEQVEVIYSGRHEGPLVKPVLPYPVHPITFQTVDVDVGSPTILEAMQYRELWDGVYHMLVSQKLWGVIAEHAPKVCPLCRRELRGVAVIDSDQSLGLQRRLPGGAIGRVSLNWVDDYYLYVTGCPECPLLAYSPVHG